MKIIYLKNSKTDINKLMENNHSLFHNNPQITPYKGGCFVEFSKDYNNYWNKHDKNNYFRNELMHSSNIGKALMIKRNQFFKKISEEMYFKNYNKYDKFILEHIISLLKKYKINTIIICGGRGSWEYRPAIYEIIY